MITKLHFRLFVYINRTAFKYFSINSKEDDWGFAHFISWDDLMEPDNAFVKDDSITIEAHVIAEAPHGVSWDSKKHTGFVGKVIDVRLFHAVCQIFHLKNLCQY